MIKRTIALQAGSSPVDTIYFSSTLNRGMRNQLESLLYFNSSQARVEPGIIDSVQTYGPPEIVELGDRLGVNVRNLAEVQCLFAFYELCEYKRLIGVVIYSRVEQHTICVLHVAVHADFEKFGVHGDKNVMLRLIGKLLESARQIKGVESLVFMYGNGALKGLPITTRIV